MGAKGGHMALKNPLPPPAGSIGDTNEACRRLQCSRAPCCWQARGSLGTLPQGLHCGAVNLEDMRGFGQRGQQQVRGHRCASLCHASETGACFGDIPLCCQHLHHRLVAARAYLK